MHYPRPLEAVFLVDFSDYSFRTIPFVAQLADALPLSLTLLYVRDDNEVPAAAEERLSSFFAEADRYPDCERVVATGDLGDVLERRMRRAPIDLLLMPASTPSTIASIRPANPSRRLQALNRLRTPLWTIGASTQLTRLGQPTRNVACWIDVREQKHPHLPFAAEYARAVGAQLHVLTEVPELTISVITDEAVPLHPEAVTERLKREVSGYGRSPTVWVNEHALADDRKKLLARCGADVLFVPQGPDPLLDWFGFRPDWFDESDCPVVMVPPTARRWELADFRELEVPQKLVS